MTPFVPDHLALSRDCEGAVWDPLPGGRGSEKHFVRALTAG